jgi:hypothetical protein
MDAKTSRMLERARAQVEADRAAAAAARDQVAAGMAQARVDVTVALRRLLEALPPDELHRGAEDAAQHIVAEVAGRLMEALKLEVRDPRLVKGSIAGSGGPFDRGAVVIDTGGALLPDSLVVTTVDPPDAATADAPLIALELAGRINRTQDRHRLLLLGDVDLAASFITELYGLAARGRFTDALDRAVARRLEDLPTEET